MREIFTKMANGDWSGSFLQFVKKYIVNPVAGISFTDVLDILVLFGLLYVVYRFIRQRRAGKLAIGIVLLFLVTLVSSALNMRAIHTILGDIYQVGIIAIVIIFQPEFRDALEKMGNTPTNIKNIGKSSRITAPFTNMISILSDATCAMARDKTGALIVIERSTKLGEYISTGVTLDAELSTELIRNIFFNKSPLHDGAVIIRDYRISAAGCILPSSQNEAVFVDMGTRHRAAVGISELSDAVVIVVSEETGTISIANNGIIKRNYNSGSLKEDLFLLLGGTSEPDSEKTASNDAANGGNVI